MNGFQIDFTLRDPRIRLNPPGDDTLVLGAEEALGISLPPSFKRWLTFYSDGAVFDIGNLLRIFPILMNNSSPSVISETQDARRHYGLRNIVVFGMNGVDFETWAFYTGCRDKAGEYPIIWIAPISVSRRRYVICNSRFDRFLNIQVQYLLRTDEEPLFTEEEAGDPQLIRAPSENYARAWVQLYQRYDPVMVLNTPDLYHLVMNARELKQKAASLIR